MSDLNDFLTADTKEFVDSIVEGKIDTVPRVPQLDILKRPQTNRASFSDGYKLAIFQLWYKAGKCPVKSLYNLVTPDPITGDVPTFTTLLTWVKGDFADRAEIIDRQVEELMQGRLVQEKILMLEKHTKLAETMQDMASDYLEENRDNLKVPNAIRLLVEGIRIERESRGIPQVLEKMLTRSDEELLKELQDIVTKAPVMLESVEEE